MIVISRLFSVIETTFSRGSNRVKFATDARVDLAVVGVVVVIVGVVVLVIVVVGIIGLLNNIVVMPLRPFDRCKPVLLLLLLLLL